MRHLDISQNKLNILCADNLQRLFAIRSFKYFSLAFFSGQKVFETFSFYFFIVYDQNICHFHTPVLLV